MHTQIRDLRGLIPWIQLNHFIHQLLWITKTSVSIQDMTLKAGIDFQLLYTQWIISGIRSQTSWLNKTAAHTADCCSLPLRFHMHWKDATYKCTVKKRFNVQKQTSHVNKYDVPMCTDACTNAKHNRRQIKKLMQHININRCNKCEK